MQFLKKMIEHPIVSSLISGVILIIIGYYFFSPQASTIESTVIQKTSEPRNDSFYIQEAIIEFEFKIHRFLYIFGDEYYQHNLDVTLRRAGSDLDGCSAEYRYESQNDIGELMGSATGLLLENPRSSNASYPFADNLSIRSGVSHLALALRNKPEENFKWLEVKIRCSDDETIWTPVRIDRVG